MTDDKTEPIYRRVNSSHGGYTNFYLNHSVGGWWATWTTDKYSMFGFEDAHVRLSPAEMREVGEELLRAADEIENRPAPVYITTGKFQVKDLVALDLDGYRDDPEKWCRVLDVKMSPSNRHWYKLGAFGERGEGSSFPHAEEDLLLVRRAGEDDK